MNWCVNILIRVFAGFFFGSPTRAAQGCHPGAEGTSRRHCIRQELAKSSCRCLLTNSSSSGPASQCPRDAFGHSLRSCHSSRA